MLNGLQIEEGNDNKQTKSAVLQSILLFGTLKNPLNFSMKNSVFQSGFSWVDQISSESPFFFFFPGQDSNWKLNFITKGKLLNFFLFFFFSLFFRLWTLQIKLLNFLLFSLLFFFCFGPWLSWLVLVVRRMCVRVRLTITMIILLKWRRGRIFSYPFPKGKNEDVHTWVWGKFEAIQI